ncbi:hypothetical protein EJB05_09976, partial [Eragrostis curvula]
MGHRSKRAEAPLPQSNPGSSTSVDQVPVLPQGSSTPVPWWSTQVPQAGSSAAGPPWGAPPPLQQSAGPSAGAWWPASTGSGAPPRIDKHQVNHSLQDWGMDSHMPGGFVGFLNNPWSPILPQQNPPRCAPRSASGPQYSPLINLEKCDEVADGARTNKRLEWTKDEEVRLVNAWLENSTDPINGNGKKTDRYWGDVTEFYNSTTPKHRTRTMKQLKDHFLKIKKKVGWFCSVWKDANAVYSSGQSDDQLMDKAQIMYEEDYKDGPFMLKHCWVILRDKPKWHAHLNLNKRKVNDDENLGEYTHVPDDKADERPIGNKAAKAQRNGKVKGKVVDYPSHLDEVVQKLVEIQGTEESRNEMLETQKRVSSERLEAARLSHLAAKENAKPAMWETYRVLSMKNTSEMSDDVKAEHLMALKCGGCMILVVLPQERLMTVDRGCIK